MITHLASAVIQIFGQEKTLLDGKRLNPWKHTGPGRGAGTWSTSGAGSAWSNLFWTNDTLKTSMNPLIYDLLKNTAHGYSVWLSTRYTFWRSTTTNGETVTGCNWGLMTLSGSGTSTTYCRKSKYPEWGCGVGQLRWGSTLRSTANTTR